jgi:hypothetical protein
MSSYRKDKRITISVKLDKDGLLIPTGDLDVSTVFHKLALLYPRLTFCPESWAQPHRVQPRQRLVGWSLVVIVDIQEFQELVRHF